MKITEFIGLLFLARDVAHSVHLNTRSSAKHSALNDFYHEIVELADSLVESYQGRYGLIGPISLISCKKTTNIVDFLQNSLKQIEESRYNVCDEKETALQNLIDEIVALYLSTLYKLKFLS